MSARTVFALFTVLLFAALVNSCSFGGLFAAQQPSPTPTRTPRPAATVTAEDTSTPTETATAASTATITAAPATATDTSAPPTDTAVPPAGAPTSTRAPAGPTNTPRPRPPTATFTPRPPPPPTNTPALAFRLTFNWINAGRPFSQNECGFFNGTHIEGKVYRADGTLLTGARATAAMHLVINESNSVPYAYPGDYRQFPTENDGRWNAEFPKWNSDFHWRIFVSAQLSDDPISYDLTGVASARDKCGQPGSANWFTADWVMH